jgi:hypothetical protein
MAYSRFYLASLVGIVLFGGIATPLLSAPVSANSGAYVTVGNVTVSPQNPEPGERVTITAQFRNSGSSSGAIQVTQVDLSGVSSSSPADNIGELGPGDSVQIPFSATFEEVGQQRLTVILRGQNPDGTVFSVEKPVYVDVEQSGGVSLAFSTVFDTDPASGATTPINATIANGDSEPITGIQLNVNGSGSVENPERIEGSIDAGSEESFEYDVTFDEIGGQTLTGTVTYTTSEGVTRTTTKSVSVDVAEPTVEADLSAASSSNQSTTTIVELTNFGNTEFSNIEVTATANGETVGRKLMADIKPDSSDSVMFNIGSSVDGSVTYTARFTAAAETRTKTVMNQSPVTGEIRLVSIESTQTGGRITLEGDAANIGGTNAESVLLSVNSTDAVSPSAPMGEYYVGEVEANEFSTFELTATVQSSTASVPVEISYIVDGTRVTTIQQIEIVMMNTSSTDERNSTGAQAQNQGPPAERSSTGPPIETLGIIIAVIVIGASGFIVYRWRQDQ